MWGWRHERDDSLPPALYHWAKLKGQWCNPEKCHRAAHHSGPDAAFNTPDSDHCFPFNPSESGQGLFETFVSFHPFLFCVEQKEIHFMLRGHSGRDERGVLWFAMIVDDTFRDRWSKAKRNLKNSPKDSVLMCLHFEHMSKIPHRFNSSPVSGDYPLIWALKAVWVMCEASAFIELDGGAPSPGIRRTSVIEEVVV